MIFWILYILSTVAILAFQLGLHHVVALGFLRSNQPYLVYFISVIG